METNKTDNLLKTFFSENKQEIPDNGFSRLVMAKIPEQTDHSWIVWIFAVTGLAISMYFGISFGIFQYVQVIFEKIPIIYLIGGIFFFPLIGTAGYYIVLDKRFQLI